MPQSTSTGCRRTSAHGRPSPSRSATEQAVLEQFGADAGAGGGSAADHLELSAADVAARVGVSRATAQRYLAALAADGLVTMKLSYGTTGRPEHRYSRP